MNTINHPDLKDDAITKVCGIAAMVGCAFTAATDVLGATLSDSFSLRSDTISDLAAGGQFDWLADLGLYAFAAAVLAVALGLARWRVGGWDWLAGRLLLVLIALAVTVIAAYEAYSQDGPKPDIHRYLVYTLGVSFPLMVWLKSNGLGKLRDWLKTALRVFAVVWFLAGPVLFLVPTAWDGFYERILAIAMMAWFALTGWLLWTGTEAKS